MFVSCFFFNATCTVACTVDYYFVHISARQGLTINGVGTLGGDLCYWMGAPRKKQLPPLMFNGSINPLLTKANTSLGNCIH